MSLNPWREVIPPHKNVLEGTFQESEFAADLSKVATGTASADYQDPRQFFERTYITEGLRLMLHSVVRRLAGHGGDPVVQLQTAFGGGKTHAMLAVYHLAKSTCPARELPGIPPILDAAGVPELPRAHVAVIDGNQISPSKPRQQGAIAIRTLWGDIAWQLGGEDGYSIVAEADRDGTSPGKAALTELFRKFSPAIVLMDETVAYVRQFEAGRSYAGGTFESNLSFVQALTEATAQVPTAMVLASLPESDREAGGERGREALKSIEHLFRRVEAIWKPVAPEEGFEIVRRRLFTPLTHNKASMDVVDAFARMYVDGAEYPADARELAYRDRLTKAYPIHPEVFDRLYEDWASLETFQRTRGVLRLMAMVIHRLWSDGNTDPLIMPGSLPLYDTTVRNELVRYLPQGWDPVLDREVDGPGAQATRIDEQNPMLGALQAARRVTRTLFLGSAPTVGRRIRGLTAQEIRIGCAQPDQQVGRYDDALRRLGDQLHYLYVGDTRYWFDTQTNLRREAETRMAKLDRDEHFIPEITQRLKAMLRNVPPFGGVHIFTPHSDIPDDSTLRLVVLSPVHPHKFKQTKSLAVVAAGDVLAHRGEQARHHQNRVVFLAIDADATASLYDQTRRYLAWKSIVTDKESLNLDQARLKEATKNTEKAEDRLVAAVEEAYRWLLAPIQEVDAKRNPGSVEWEEQRVATGGVEKSDAITRAVFEKPLVIDKWSPFHLRELLRTWYFRSGNTGIPISEVWLDSCKYPYLPRLTTQEVLTATVSEGVTKSEFFGYALAREDGRFTGLVVGEASAIYCDASSLLVEVDAALAQKRVEQAPPSTTSIERGESTAAPKSAPPGGVRGTASTGAATPAAPAKLTRFHGAVSLNPARAGLDFAKIADEVIRHFSGKIGTSVRINVEFEAQRETGFDESTRRTVEENARVLGFSHADFEEE